MKRAKQVLAGVFFSVVALGCARGAKPSSIAAAQPAEAEPINDTIQEFRRGERIACAEGTDLVYVLSRDGGLHSFDPGELRFRRIGSLECPGTGRAHPHSMAVDRSGQAWVGYDNGVLALANVVTGECTSSRVNLRGARIGSRFGMGFAPTPDGGIGGETLFLTTEPTLRGFTRDGRLVRGNSLLARIDDGVHVTVTGEFPPTLRGLSGELSSRSDGRLFAFFTGDPFQLAEIDPSTADVRWQKQLEGMRFAETGTGSWAFAAVGQEFYFFWANRDVPSTVTRLREDGTIEHVLRNAGMEIVGAGASTCATRKTRPPVSDPPSAADDASAAPVATPEPAPVERPAVAPPVPKPPATAPPVPFSKLPRLPPPNAKPTPRRTPKTPSAPAPSRTPNPKRRPLTRPPVPSGVST